LQSGDYGGGRKTAEKVEESAGKSMSTGKQRK